MDREALQTAGRDHAVAALEAAAQSGRVVTLHAVSGDHADPAVGMGDGRGGRSPLARACAMAACLAERGHPAVAVIVTDRQASVRSPLEGARMAAVTLDRAEDAVAEDLHALGMPPLAAEGEARRWTAAAAVWAGVRSPQPAQPAAHRGWRKARGG